MPAVFILLFSFLAVPAFAQNRVLWLDGDSSYLQLPAGIFDDLHQATVEAWVNWQDRARFSQWFAFGVNDQWSAMGLNHWGEDVAAPVFRVHRPP